MENNFDRLVKELRKKINKMIGTFSIANQKTEKVKLELGEDMEKEFFSLIDKVNFILMEDNDNFYGYFLIQMEREIRFDISSPTGVNFKGAKYVIYFNPLMFLSLNLKQMESTIKHEILHILSKHLIRAKELRSNYSSLAINMAMDLVVNKYIKDLPPYATTLEWINLKYELNLEPYASFEYYVDKLQTAIDLLEEEAKAPVDDSYHQGEDTHMREDAQKDNSGQKDDSTRKYDSTQKDDSTRKNERTQKDDSNRKDDSNQKVDGTHKKDNDQNNVNSHKNDTTQNDKNDHKNEKIVFNEQDKNEYIKTEYDAAKTHDIWEESSNIDVSTLQEFTEKVIQLSEKGEIPAYINNMIAALKDKSSELPWNLYLNRIMGTVERGKKKTITRKSRRQPERLDLRGELRGHKANIVVAIDISGSISEEEFKHAIIEVLNIVKNYNHEITILECDDKIRRAYKVKSLKDIKDRINKRGSTKFTPVIEYANQNKVNLLIYFTDGKGEDKLKLRPRGYNILWVISGKGDELSLKEPYGVVKKLSTIKIKDNILDITDASRGGYSMQNQEGIL